MFGKLSDTLDYISNTLGNQRFAGLDQNPKGIRDLLGTAVQEAKRLERELAQAQADLQDCIAEHE
jgi:hypothetical protein